MSKKSPSVNDIDVLLAFRQKLCADDVQIYAVEDNDEANHEGVLQIGSPSYSELVSDFFHAARDPVWMDKDYVEKQAGEVLSDPTRIASATLLDIKTLLTFCVRGERFCDGYWGGLVKGGQIKAVLNRLSELRESMK